MRIDTLKGPVEIRELHSMSEMTAAEDIQLQVWGPITPHPKEILIPIQYEGGLLAGAFAQVGDWAGQMVGLIFGFPTKDPTIMHSQLLATLEHWRGQGIGARMKWFQRAWCLERGIQQVRWTVDPLRAANADLNIRHLGGISSTYYPDYYGTMQGIDSGAPTDRLLVEWDLQGQRAAQRAASTPEDHGFPQAEPAISIVENKPFQPRLDLACPKILIQLPENFVRLSKTEPELALDWRMQTRTLFLHYFANGYTITEFTRVGGCAYLLEKGEPSHES
jgi:chorismate synthase